MATEQIAEQFEERKERSKDTTRHDPPEEDVDNQHLAMGANLSTMRASSQACTIALAPRTLRVP